MAQRIGTVLDEHYFRTSDQPNDWQLSLLSDDESDYEWERDGEPVIRAIANAAEIPEEAASDIQEVLEIENATLITTFLEKKQSSQAIRITIKRTRLTTVGARSGMPLSIR
jgi:hypothetical protein